MAAVAPEVLDKDVGCVGLGREAVVAVVHASVCHGEAVDVEGVEAICVFGKRLYQLLEGGSEKSSIESLPMHYSKQRR